MNFYHHKKAIIPKAIQGIDAIHMFRRIQVYKNRVLSPSVNYGTNKDNREILKHLQTTFSRTLQKKSLLSGVIEMGLFDHELVYCSSKTSLLKLNEHNENSFKSMKNY